MKIGVVGCGALGSYYGAKLLRAGEDVHFLLRSDHAVVSQQGVWVRSPEGDFHVRPNCAASPEQIGACDLVLIGMKTTANHVLPELLPKLISERTILLTLQNGLGNEAWLAQWFGEDRVMGGLCFVCLNRERPGVIRHLAHGRISIGEFRKPPQVRTRQVREMFLRAGISCEMRENLEQAHWEKLVWNIPFNGLGVASAAGYDAVVTGQVMRSCEPGSCLATDKLLAEPRWHELVHELMVEVIATANALGFPVSQSLAVELIEQTRVMGAYQASTLVDFERGQPLELESLFLKPLLAARRAGVSAPRLEAMCAVLRVLDDGR